MKKILAALVLSAFAVSTIAAAPADSTKKATKTSKKTVKKHAKKAKADTAAKAAK